jgi:hypothetical protein
MSSTSKSGCKAMQAGHEDIAYLNVWGGSPYEDHDDAGTEAYFTAYLGYDLRKSEVTLKSVLQRTLAKMGANEAAEMPGNATPRAPRSTLRVHPRWRLLICGGRELPVAIHGIRSYAWGVSKYWSKATSMTWDLGAEGAGRASARLGVAKLVYHAKNVTSHSTKLIKKGPLKGPLKRDTWGTSSTMWPL